MCCNVIPRRLLLAFAIIGLVLGVNRLFVDDVNAEEPEVRSDTPAALNFKMKTIDGQEVQLSKYHGQVVLMVNVASKCGLTKQYKQLQKLHETYEEKGLSILGFPANNFGKQEPGSNDEIATFCEKNYGVEFDLFAKVSVKGEDICPLYAYLTSGDAGVQEGEIRWNFEKFLIGRDGTVVARFSPRTKPDDEKVLQAIEAELAKPTPESVQAVEEGE